MKGIIPTPAARSNGSELGLSGIARVISILALLLGLQGTLSAQNLFLENLTHCVYRVDVTYADVACDDGVMVCDPNQNTSGYGAPAATNSNYTVPKKVCSVTIYDVHNNPVTSCDCVQVYCHVEDFYDCEGQYIDIDITITSTTTTIKWNY